MRVILNEETIVACLSGVCAPAALNIEAEGAVERVDDIRVNIHVREMRDDFVVTSEMLVRLCDAAIAHQLSPGALTAVAFAIVVSGHFEWHDEIVAEVLHDWSSPEVNYRLNSENLHRFRAWLTRDESYPEKPNLTNDAAGRIVSVTAKISHR